MRVNTFVYGAYTYSYAVSRENRKTYSLIVKPDLSLIVKVPQNAKAEKIKEFLKKKWVWLERQIRYFKKFKKKTEKEYVSGEQIYYLGKQYKLYVRTGANNKVTVSKYRITVTSKKTTPASIKKVLIAWFEGETERIFQERFAKIKGGLCVLENIKLHIRSMNKRWGSYVGKTKIFLNPKLIHTSIECIDYVIVHELCHLEHKNHTKAFYRLLKKRCPNWIKTKDKLEDVGSRV